MAGVQYVDIGARLEKAFLEQAEQKLIELQNNAARMKTLQTRIENRILRHLRARTKAGIDSDGNKFPRYKKSYNKAYQFKHTKLKKNNYASGSKSDDIQFSGQIFKNLNVKVSDIVIDKEGISFEVEVGVRGARNKLVAKALESSIGVARNKRRYRKSKRLFLAVSDKGPWGNKLEKELATTIKNVLF